MTIKQSLKALAEAPADQSDGIAKARNITCLLISFGGLLEIVGANTFDNQLRDATRYFAISLPLTALLHFVGGDKDINDLFANRWKYVTTLITLMSSGCALMGMTSIFFHLDFYAGLCFSFISMSAVLFYGLVIGLAIKSAKLDSPEPPASKNGD